MSTTFEQVGGMLKKAGIRYELDDETRYLKTVWMRDKVPVMILVILLEDGELVQLRAPGLLTATDPESKPLLFRAMLQMAFETRLVQFEYDPIDGEVSTCIDVALEDAELTSEQLLRCCALLLDVSFLARDRLKTILETGKDPALDAEGVDEEEARQRQSQLDAMVEVGRKIRNSRPS
jgi:hypothetical protein